MPLSPPQLRHNLHTRHIVCRGFKRQDGLWDIEAQLSDTKSVDYANRTRGTVFAGQSIHLMQVRLSVDLDLTIHAVEAVSDATPFGLCKQATAVMQNLVGLQIGAGWMREARKRIPRRAGCTHLFELLGPLATTAYQSLHQDLEQREKSKVAPQAPPILDTCLALGRSTEVVKVEWPQFYQPEG